MIPASSIIRNELKKGEMAAIKVLYAFLLTSIAFEGLFAATRPPAGRTPPL
jgi:hypothetical protein